MNLKDILKEIAKPVFGDYQLIRLYAKDLGDVIGGTESISNCGEIKDRNEVTELGTEDIKTHAWYAGPHALGYGIILDQQLVCTCWYWTKEDRRVPERFFPQLKDDEAVMVDLITANRLRGRGYASSLISYSERKLREAGFRRLWTWVWHSNGPSIRAFEKSGWKYIGFLIEVQLFRTSKRIQIRLRPRKSSQS